MKTLTERWDGWKAVLVIAWPLIIANSFWNFQVTIDRIFLSNYSTETLGAAMSAVGVFWAPMALVQQTAAYVTTFIAQYYGAKKPERIGSALWQSIYISFIGGILFLALIPLATPMFRAFDHSPSMQQLEIDYFQALCWSALPMALVAAASGYFMGLGRSSMTVWINAVGLISNVIFDYILIFGNWGAPELGITGAGYATTLATWCAAIYAFYLVFRSKDRELHRLFSGWRWDGDLTKRFLKYGVPSGMQWALEGLAFTAFLVIVGRMPNGDAALAGSGITVTIMMLSILPAIGVAQAVSILVGQHLGNNNPDEATRASWNGVQISMLYICTMGLTFILFPGFYISFFANPEDQQLWDQVESMVPYLLLFVAAFTCFDCLNFVLSFALKGAGDTRFVTIVALTLPWPIMVIPTWLMEDWEGAIYWAWGAASLFIMTQALVFLARFMGGKWRDMRVIEST